MPWATSPTTKKNKRRPGRHDYEGVVSIVELSPQEWGEDPIVSASHTPLLEMPRVVRKNANSGMGVISTPL